jgi:hypothetical protein
LNLWPVATASGSDTATPTRLFTFCAKPRLSFSGINVLFAVSGQSDPGHFPTQSRNPVATGEAIGRAMVDDMTTDFELMKLGVQQTLDELFAESLIPFRLSARAVESIGMEEYIVRFHDSRLHSIDVSWQRGQTFKAIFRATILDRVARLSIRPRLARTAWPFHQA